MLKLSTEVWHKVREELMRPLAVCLLLVAGGCANLSLLNSDSPSDASANSEAVGAPSDAAVDEAAVAQNIPVVEVPPVLADELGMSAGVLALPVDSQRASSPNVRSGNAGLFERAVAFMQAGQYQEAEALLLEVTASQPELAGPWINLARVYAYLENFEEARLALNHALDANPRNCQAHNQLGVLSREHGDFATAESHYKACLQQRPDFSDAYLNLGILYELYLGKLPQALAAYRTYQALKLRGQALDLPDEAGSDRRVKGWVMDLERRLGG